MAKTRAQKAAAAKARRNAAKAARTTAAGQTAGTVAKGGVRRVRATAPGFYDNKRLREGDVFTIKSASEFSSKWMVYVDKNTPEKITTGAEELQRKHDEVLNDKLAEKGATGGANPLGAE